MTGQLDDFTQSYAEAALWSSADGGDILSSDGLDALAAPTLRAMYADCVRFQDLARQAGCGDLFVDGGAKVARDFWLTRCHHGAGFWDGDYTEPAATLLTRIAHELGEVTLYVGDDGLIYQAGSEDR